MDLDGQSIEKRDFPVVRRGYEPAAVDAHLRAIAAGIAELNKRARQGESVGSAAATQVQGIIDAADAAAAQIVNEAQAQAARTTKEAELAAQSTRDRAVATSQAHIAAVGQAAATLRSRVETMDADLQALTNTLRSGSAKLAQDLGALEQDMETLYDSAGARSTSSPSQEPSQSSIGLPEPTSDNGGQVTEETPATRPPPPPSSADVDSARLIALNMALNGDPRAQTERYLAEHFDLPDRERLVAEVYAAIEG